MTSPFDDDDDLDPLCSMHDVLCVTGIGIAAGLTGALTGLILIVIARKLRWQR